MSTKITRFVAFALVGLLTVLALAACSGSNSVNVSEKTYQMQLSKNTVKPGEVTFHIKNEATDQNHEFVVVQTDLPEDQLPLNSDGDVDEDQITSMGEAEEIEPGTTKDLTLNLPAGRYVVMCNMPGHYTQGMHSVVMVK